MSNEVFIITSFFRCPACKRDFPLEENNCIEGCCKECHDKGYWMDPAGTLQQGEDEPWRDDE